MTERKDQEWVRALKAQEPAAEQALWQALFAWATALARRQRLDEDVAMEGMIAAYTRIINRGINQYASRGPFLGFCRQILVREVYRQAKKQKSVAAKLVDIEVGDDDITLGAADPPLQVDEAVVKNRLQPCLDGLTGQERLIIHLLYESGQTPAAVATEQTMTRNYVNVLAHRARTKLRTCLEGRGYRNAEFLWSV